MAKTASEITRSPYDFTPGAPVSARDVLDVVEALNYAQLARVNLMTWTWEHDAIRFPATAGATTVLEGLIYIPPGMSLVWYRAGVYLDGAINDQFDVTLTIGDNYLAGTTESNTLSFVHPGSNGRLIDHDGILHSDLVADDQFHTFVVQINHVSGSSSNAYLDHLHISAWPSLVATGLPNPTL